MRLAAVTLVCASVTACEHSASKPPARLVDGTPAGAASVELEDVDVASVVTAADTGASTKLRCDAASGAERIVERIGVDGASLTAVEPGGRAAHACDFTRLDVRPCGVGYGRLENGGPTDPRLSLTCRNSAGSPLAFAWVAPARGVAYVAVAQSGYVEVYPVAGDTPVRVTALDVDLELARARLEISEHGVDGRRLRAYTLVAQVAG